LTDVEQESNQLSVDQEMCLYLPAERRNGKERGRQAYDTEASMRRQTVYEETMEVRVAQGFEVAVLRRLCTHSLGGQHGQYLNAIILQAERSKAG
jgi:hypothetical protein